MSPIEQAQQAIEVAEAVYNEMYLSYHAARNERDCLNRVSLPTTAAERLELRRSVELANETVSLLAEEVAEKRRQLADRQCELEH